MARPDETFDIGLGTPDPLGPDALGRLDGIGKTFTAMGLLVAAAIVLFMWMQGASASAVTWATSAWVSGLLLGAGNASLKVARRLRGRG